MKIVTASSYGFCSGVRSAVDKALKAAERAGRLSLPCYVTGSLVHSSAVSAMLRDHGIVEIDSPEGHEPGIVVIRTHGITDQLRAEFERGGFIIEDATCPVVLRNARLLKSAVYPVIIGRKSHSEIKGLAGCGDIPVIESPDDLVTLGKGIEYSAVIQTTLSSSLLESILDRASSMGIHIECITSICGASEERRRALREIADEVEAFAVVGDESSANTSELVAIASSLGKPSFLISSPDSIPPSLFCYNTVGLTAGASAPDDLIEAVRRRLENNGR